MNILGINAYHADASACVVQDGRLVVAVAEERLNRQRHWAGFPSHSIRCCLEKAGLQPQDLDYVAISRDPEAHLHRRVLNAALNQFPRVMTVKDRLNSVGKARDPRTQVCEALGISGESLRARFHNVEHHRAHLASSFLVSPFEEAALLSVDGFGDFVSTMTGSGDGCQISVMDWIEYPHSLGLLYTAITQYLGFPHYGDEGKVMGMAAYGIPRFRDAFNEIVHLLEGGKFELNLEYFTHHTHGVEMLWDSGPPEMVPVWSSALVELLGPTRRPENSLETAHFDIAASLQSTLEDTLAHVCQHLYHRSPVPNLCLAGGVALNCSFNGKIQTLTPFKRVWVQPAAGDDGTSIGAAFYVHNQLHSEPRAYIMQSAAAGPSFTSNDIEDALRCRNLSFANCEVQERTAHRAAQLIAGGSVVGWYQGAMEFGPRALGQRSILADPRRPDIKDILNNRIKHRESFRPFAASILLEELHSYFEGAHESPFMMMAYPVREEKRAQVPGIVHQDGTCRVQTVGSQESTPYRDLLEAFYQETGVPLLVNTSFNENEPIVCTPEDAIECFLKTRMDILILGNFIVSAKPDAL